MKQRRGGIFNGTGYGNYEGVGATACGEGQVEFAGQCIPGIFFGSPCPSGYNQVVPGTCIAAGYQVPTTPLPGVPSVPIDVPSTPTTTPSTPTTPVTQQPTQPVVVATDPKRDGWVVPVIIGGVGLVLLSTILAGGRTARANRRCRCR